MDVKSKIKLTSYNDLFGEADKIKQVAKMAKKAADAETVMLDPKILMQFPGHPFCVTLDESMRDLIDSVKEYGILDPLWIIERSKNHIYPKDGYYIIAGHRRDFSAIKAELSEVPVKILSLTDKEATDYMIYSNIQRPKIYPSELAKAFKLQMEQNQKAGITANESSEQSRKRQRYIRLTYLIEGFLNAIDENKMQMTVGYELSFLTFEHQLKLFSYLKQNDIKPTVEQAKVLKEASKNNPDLEFGHYYLDNLFMNKGKVVMSNLKKEIEVKSAENLSIVQEDDNIPGQTSIENDFPEYLPEEKKVNVDEGHEGRITHKIEVAEQDEVENCSAEEVFEEVKNENQVPKKDYLGARESNGEQNKAIIEPKQSSLPLLKNNEQRKEWLTKYKDWGLWYRDEHIDVNYYKYDFEDGSRLVVAEYPQRFSYWSSGHKDEHYYHLLEKNKKGYKSVYDEKYRQSTDSETYLIDFLKNLQSKRQAK